MVPLHRPVGQPAATGWMEIGHDEHPLRQRDHFELPFPGCARDVVGVVAGRIIRGQARFITASPAFSPA